MGGQGAVWDGLGSRSTLFSLSLSFYRTLVLLDGADTYDFFCTGQCSLIYVRKYIRTIVLSS